MENRRQSGLWSQNPAHDYYDQEPQESTGPYEYYEPPPRRSSDKHRQSFSERADVPPQPSSNGAPLRSHSKKIRDIAEGVTQKLQRHAPDHSISDDLARTQHVNSTRLPSSAKQPPRVDPDTTPNSLRSDEPWSPTDLSSPRAQDKPRHASNASETLRRGSVPERSPLQKLEMDFASKRDKRAKIEQAEQRARQKNGGGGGGEEVRSERQQASQQHHHHIGEGRHDTLKGEKGRAVSDWHGRPSEDAYGGRERGDENNRRQVSASTPSVQPPVTDGSGASRFRRATEALKGQTSPEKRYYARQQQEERRAEAPFTDQEQRSYPRPPLADRGADGAQYSESKREQPIRNYGGRGDERVPIEPVRDETDLGRTASGKYRHRARDAGFAGAAAAVAGGQKTAADRGKAAHERRKSHMVSHQQGSPQQSPISPARQESRDGGIGRSGSKRLQKRPPPSRDWHGKGENRFREPQDRDQEPQSPASNTAPEPHIARQALQTSRAGVSAKQEEDAAHRHQDPDPLPPSRVANATHDPLSYKIPPQTAAGQQAREKVGFGVGERPGDRDQEDRKHHHLGGMFHRHEHAHRSYQTDGRPLEEWRNADVARLSLEDVELEQAAAGGEKDATWWDKSGKRSSSDRSRQTAMPQYDGPYEEEAKLFRPQLLLKCGPLLRYTGMRSGDGEREVWRGSIMIVTHDDKSDYSPAPTLRIFAQPAGLHAPPPRHLLESGHELPPEYEDPIAGQVKVSRTGRPLYVRPVHDIDGDVDLSREENPQGLFAATRTPMLGPQNVSGPDGRQSQHITFQDKSRTKKRDGEKLGRYREVRAARLHAERGCTFWRFNVEIELASTQRRVAYRINRGPAVGFWVPARGETMNIMFHSCNGFSLNVDPNQYSGPDPLWRDVLNRHQARPFHVMLGGGDQIYNDAVMRDTQLFADWLAEKNPERKHRADFTPEMQDELETFYLDRYAMWFSQGLFGMANAQIPMVNLADDHDIIDGFGSYPHSFMSTRVFAGLGAVAFKYYMLFQHQTTLAETEREEPSWVLGASPGPYINELSRSVFVRLGKKVGFLGLDCRTERMRDCILSEQSYDIVFERLREEIAGRANEAGQQIRHLIVLLGVPIAYPRLNFLENILTSNVMVPLKAIGRTGMLGGFVNKFDGGVEILDDLDDHWTAKHHKQERNWFVQELQQLAAEYSVRVTILGGDVHLGAVGQFYTPKKFGVPKDRDHRYMPNVVSSAIVNKPPPNTLADVLNRRNRVHHLDDETDEDLIPMFDFDVDGSKRGNKCLLPRRNYATIREYLPGQTPPGTPKRARTPEMGSSMDGSEYERSGNGFARRQEEEARERDRRFPPGSMKRTMSLTRGPAALVRRFSGSGRSKNPPRSLAPEHGRPYSANQGAAPGMGRSASFGGDGGTGDGGGSYFPPAGETRRPSFHRRPTNLSVKEARKAAAKGGADGNLDGREPGHIDLQGGLDISLNMEIDQHDPSGATVGYRLLVPALWYEGQGDENTTSFKTRGASFLDRFRGSKSKRGRVGDDGYSRSPSPSEEGSDGRRSLDREEDRHAYSQPTMDRMPQQQQAGFLGDRDGTHDPRRNFSGPPASSSANTAGPRGPGGAYDKGYNLASPPVGASGQRQQEVREDHRYPQSHRRSSAPTTDQRLPSQPPQQRANGPWRPWRRTTQPGRQQEVEEYSDDGEGSLTPSDEYVDAPPPPATTQARRPSKAERFFGIGDEGGPWGGGGGGARRQSLQQREEEDGGFEEQGQGNEKRKPGWRIWR